MRIQSQQGAALMTVLMLLIIATLLAISGMQSSILQEKMVGAVRDSQLAMEGTEVATREAEAYLETIATTGGFDGTGCLYPQGGAPDDEFAADTWTNDKSCTATQKDWLGEAPRYFIELGGTFSNNTASSIQLGAYGDIGAGDEVTAFKIVARSTGGSANSQRVIAVYYGRKF